MALITKLRFVGDTMEINYDVITFSSKYVYFKKAFFLVTLFRVGIF